MDLPEHVEAVGAACLVWSMLRAIQWDDQDDPDDRALYDRVLHKARAEYPWLDELTDQVETAILGHPMADADDAPEPATWVDEDGSAFIAPSS